MKTLKRVLYLCFVSIPLLTLSQSEFYQTAPGFMATLLCDDMSNVVPVEATNVLPLGGAVRLPDFGMNSQLVYGSSFTGNESNYHLGTANVQNAISAISPSHLRFPGGQLSNAFHLFTTEVSLITDSDGAIANTPERQYFLEAESAYSDADMPAEDLADENHYLYEEGASQRLGAFLRIDADDDVTRPNGLVNNIDDELAFYKNSASKTETDGSYQIFQRWIDRDPKYLKDFIHLTEEQDITPVYCLKMYDPLLFVMADNDTETEDTMNGNLQFSPLLHRLLGSVDYTADETTDFFDDNIAAVRMEIINSSINEIRLQLVKYCYEYIKALDYNVYGLNVSQHPPALTALQSEFEGYMNNMDQTQWNAFVDLMEAEHSNILQRTFRFELGNEVWASWQYKYLPHAGLSGLNPNQMRPDADFYAELCSNAMTQIDDLFDQSSFQAQVGVVTGNRVDCDWSEILMGNQFFADRDPDAWILHYYSNYEDPFAVDPTLNTPALMASPTGHLLATVTQDFTDVQGNSIYDGLPIWITEFNVKHLEEYEHYIPDDSNPDGPEIPNLNGIHGSWVDLMSKFSLINQYLALSPEFNSSEPLFNPSSILDAAQTPVDVPQLDIEFMMLHTFYEEAQPSILIDGAGEIQFGDQGMLAIIMDRLTRNGYVFGEPFLFSDDSDNIEQSSHVADDTRLRCEGNASPDDSRTFLAPHLWAWKVYQDPTDPCSYRYLIANASPDCQILDGFLDFDHSNTDLFVFNPDYTPPSGEQFVFPMVDLDADKVGAIQDPSTTETWIDQTGFCYHSGDFPDAYFTDGEDGIIIPPFALAVLNGISDQPLSIEADPSINSSCSGSTNGSADISVTGGIGDYSYEWTGPNGFTADSEDISSIEAGDYVVTVTDATGCQVSASYEVLTTTFSVTEESITGSCPDVGTGAVDVSVTASNATGTLTYLWDDPGASTTEDLIEVIGGNYSLTVSDDQCSTAFPVMVPELLYQSSYDASALDDICASSSLIDLTGLISLQLATGESITFSGTGVIGQEFDPAGLEGQSVTISLQISDSDCTWPEESFNIAVLPSFTLSAISTNTCPVEDNGSIIITAFGGVDPVEYDWNDGVTSQNRSGLAAGVYSVTATDANLCAFTYGNIVVGTDPVTDAEALMIEEDDSWSGESRQFLGNLTIINGVTLNLDACDFQFAPGTGIIIEAGGELITDNCTITGFDCSDQLWNGIEVRGRTQESQQIISGESAQGRLTMNHSSLSKAEVGIINHHRGNVIFDGIGTTGGIIKLESSDITNCQRALYMAPYRNWIGNVLSAERSRFYETRFEWNEQLIEPSEEQTSPMIQLDEIHDIYFRGCTFINTNENALKLPTWMGDRAAILARKSTSLHLIDRCNGPTLPCPTDQLVHTSMQGFRYGLVQQGGRADVRNGSYKNYRSIYVQHSKGSRFTGNAISALPKLQYPIPTQEPDPVDDSWRTHYGLYLDKCNAYWVEGNQFDMYIDEELVDYEPPTALFVRGSGPSSEQIYRNEIKNSNYGSIAYDDNRGTSTTEGLHFDCNDYLDNYKGGINVTSTLGNATPDGWGVAYQGVAPPQTGGPGTSAGNFFSGQSNYDVRNDGHVDYILYYWNQEDTPIGVDFVEEGNMNEWDFSIDPRTCPSNLDEGIDTKYNRALLAYNSSEQISTQLSALVDGGDTESLLTEVILTQYGEALELYYELMAKSPDLSEAVMIEAIQKEAELPPLLLTLILESNPHAAKSGKVQKELDDRSIPLEEYQRAMIDAGLALLGNKERMESLLAQQLTIHETALNQAIQLTLDDESISDKLTYIDGLITGMENLTQRYQRIDLHLAYGDVQGAELLLNSIAEDIDLTDRKDQEYQDYQDCYAIQLTLIQDQSTVLSPDQESTLGTIALKHNTRASAFAKILLMQYGTYAYDEILVDPEAVQKSRIRRRSDKVYDKKEIEIYPVPAYDYIQVVLPSGSKFTSYTISDLGGGIIMQEKISSQQRQLVIIVGHLSNGTYTLTFSSSDGEPSKSKKFEIGR